MSWEREADVSAPHVPSPRFLTGLFFSCPLSVPRRAEPASEEREGDPGQPDGPHAGLLQEELRQPLSRQPGQRRPRLQRKTRQV